MSNVIYFIVCFSLILGPKIAVIDLSILIPAILLPFLVTSGLKLSKEFSVLFVSILLLASYQAFLQILYNNIDLISIGRLVRAAFTVLLVGFMLSSGGVALGRKIYGMLKLVLLVHAVIVIISAHFYPINEFFSAISGNDRVKEYRASGLLAGFDIAGTLSVIGMLMIVFQAYKDDNTEKINLMFITVFFVSCYYSSRVSMAIAAILYVYFVIRNLKSIRKSLFSRLVFAFGALAFSYKFFISIFEIFEVTFSAGILDVSEEIKIETTSKHSIQDKDNFLWASMFFLPGTYLESVFGVGSVIEKTDVGYVKHIFRVGFLGLIMAIYSHISYIRRSFNGAALIGSRDVRVKPVLFTFGLMLLLTLKNDYIFVRGVFPTFLILVASCSFNFDRQFIKKRTIIT